MPPKRATVPGPRPRRVTRAAVLRAAQTTPLSAADLANASSPIDNARPTPQIEESVPKIEVTTEERVVVACETPAEKADPSITSIGTLSEEVVSVGSEEKCILEKNGGSNSADAFAMDTVDGSGHEIGSIAGASVPENGEEGRGVRGDGTVTVKHVVRKVVKKLVKKKVPKRMIEGLVCCKNKELENQNAVKHDGNANSLDTVKDCGARNSESMVSAPREVGNPGISVLEAGNPVSSSVVEMEIEKTKSFEAAEEPIAQNVGDVAEKPDSASCELNFSGVVQMEVENPKLGKEAPNMVLGEDRNGGCVMDNVESGCGGNAGVCEDIGKCDQGSLHGKNEKGTVGVILSGEMEALERRRRRKTEIFIGGLDKDAKERDIRKVFEEVGEIVEVRLLMNNSTGKNKGYAFVRYASADDAKQALEKYSKVEICGKQCSTAPVEGNDTLFIGNIDKKWKNEDVIKLLKEIGIEKLDKVTVMLDPTNVDHNRGFAFLEFQTSKDAQNAFKKLQKKDVSGKLHNMKVSWAEPLSEPDEEEMLKVKSVYAESLPSSWDDEKVKHYFEKFGEIENVVHARSLRSPRRKDFAFINFATREAALACIESFNNETLCDEGSKVNVKVSLANPVPKSRSTKRPSIPLHKEISKEKPKTIQRGGNPNHSRNEGVYIRSNHSDGRRDRRPSTNDELVQLLREQATWRESQRIFGTGEGSSSADYLYSLPGRKRPYSALGDEPIYPGPWGNPHLCMERSYPVASPRTLSEGVGLTSRAYYHQQGSMSTSGYGQSGYSNGFQRQEAPYHESSCLLQYRHYRY